MPKYYCEYDHLGRFFVRESKPDGQKDRYIKSSPPLTARSQVFVFTASNDIEALALAQDVADRYAQVDG